jgi:hypothetical protein
MLYGAPVTIAMRTLAASTTLAFSALLVTLAACSGETIGRPPPPPVDWRSFARVAPEAGAPTPTAKEGIIAEQYAAAVSSPQPNSPLSTPFAALGGLFDDDAHFAFPGREDARGRDAVIREHGALFGPFEQRHLVLSRVWRTADVQIAEWTMAGVQAHAWMGVAATQRSITFKGLTLLWTKDDGIISDCHVYFDVAVVKALLGAGPKELSGLVAPSLPSGPVQYIDQTGHEQDNVAIVRTALDALESNESAYVDLRMEDVELNTLEHADPARGKDEARARFKALHKSIAQLDTTMLNGWAVAQFGIVEYTIDGEQRGPLAWIPTQRDQVVRLHLVDVNEMRDGKISRVWRYDNPGEIMSPGP